MPDLEAFARKNPHFTLVPVMAKAASGEWRGEPGLISAAMLTKYVKGIATPIYYLSGPAAMVAAMRKLLVEARPNEDNTRTEEFSGYQSVRFTKALGQGGLID